MWLGFVSCVSVWTLCSYFFFFFNDTSTTEIYTLSLHDALPICSRGPVREDNALCIGNDSVFIVLDKIFTELAALRSEEHTSELQSRPHLVCRLLLEKKKTLATGHPAALCQRTCHPYVLTCPLVT